MTLSEKTQIRISIATLLAAASALVYGSFIVSNLLRDFDQLKSDVGLLRKDIGTLAANSPACPFAVRQVGSLAADQSTTISAPAGSLLLAQAYARGIGDKEKPNDPWHWQSLQATILINSRACSSSVEHFRDNAQEQHVSVGCLRYLDGNPVVIGLAKAVGGQTSFLDAVVEFVVIGQDEKCLAQRLS